MKRRSYVGVDVGDEEGVVEGVGVGAAAGPTVTVEPVAKLRIVTFLPESPEANRIVRLYLPLPFACCWFGFHVSSSALTVSFRRVTKISVIFAPMKLFKPVELAAPPPRSIAPRT